MNKDGRHEEGMWSSREACHLRGHKGSPTQDKWGCHHLSASLKIRLKRRTLLKENTHNGRI